VTRSWFAELIQKNERNVELYRQTKRVRRMEVVRRKTGTSNHEAIADELAMSFEEVRDEESDRQIVARTKGEEVGDFEMELVVCGFVANMTPVQFIAGSQYVPTIGTIAKLT